MMQQLRKDRGAAIAPLLASVARRSDKPPARRIRDPEDDGFAAVACRGRAADRRAFDPASALLSDT